MTADIVDVCSGMLLVGRVAEQAAGRILYYEYAKKAPVMLDIFRYQSPSAISIRKFNFRNYIVQSYKRIRNCQRTFILFLNDRQTTIALT